MLSHRYRNTILHVGLFILIVVACVFIIEAMITRILYIWDEALYGNNSLEMLLSGNLMHHTSNFKLSDLNTKPPLVLWLQVLSMKLWGTNEWGLRFPTFMALISTLLVVYRFIKKNFRDTNPFIILFIIVTTPGLVVPHVFLSGDLDGFLVLFATVCLLKTYELSINTSIKGQDLYLLGFFVYLGFMTKSTAILLLLPSMALLLASNKKLLAVLRNKHFYFSCAAFITLIAIYYALKESVQPGTLKVVFFSEIERLYKNIMPWHQRGFWHYGIRIYESLNPLYLFLTLIILPVYFSIKSVKFKKVVLNFLLATLLYVLLISIPAAKLDWYVAPILPLWCILLGVALSELLRLALDRLSDKLSVQYILIALVLLCSIYPIYAIRKHINKTTAFYQNEEKEMAFLYHLDALNRPKNIHIISAYPEVDGHSHHNEVTTFYQKIWKEKNRSITIHYSANELKHGDTVVFYGNEQRAKLSETFDLRLLDSNIYGQMLLLRSPLE